MRKHRYNCPTYSITKDFDWSETENNRLLFEMTAKYGTPYFSNYINSDMNPQDARSMCPLFGKEKVLVLDGDSKDFHLSTIENLYKDGKHNKQYSILLNGEVKEAQLHRFDGLTFYKVRTINGHEVILSGNHQNLTLGGVVKQTEDLTTDDYLPFTMTAYPGDDALTYEDGLLIGVFMTNGSLNGNDNVTYLLNDDKEDFVTQIIEIARKKFGAKYSIRSVNSFAQAGETGTYLQITFASKMLRGLIEDYVFGTALGKEWNVKCINHSLKFRQGILDGLLKINGTSNCIYVASKKAVTFVCAMLASMGVPTNVCADAEGKVYRICLYNIENSQTKYGDVYVKQDGYMWFRIESVEKVESENSIGYCFEVLNDDEPYFMLPSGMVTHNCRLRLDLRELRKKNGGFFGSGESTGSIGVVTLNLPRLAYKSSNEEDFYTRLDRLMDIAARSLTIKRKVCTQLMDEGLYPYTKRYLGSFDNHFSTIGLVGMNEAARNAKWLRTDLTTPEGQAFAQQVLNHMRNRLSDYQEQNPGVLFNLEATPAESTTYRFAKHDVEDYPDIITAAKPGQTPFYTNSSHIPVGYTDDIFEALDLQDDLQTLYTSGTVFHAFLGERMPDWKSAMTLVRKIAENYRLPYYTLSPTYSVCPEHNYIVGEHAVCPYCGKETEVYSRITGYYRPVKNWNDGKAQEFKNRKEYVVMDATADEPTVVCATCRIPEPSVEIEQEEEPEYETILIASQTCPNCELAKQTLDQAGVKYKVIYANEHPDFVRKMHVMTAPTLIVYENGNPKKITNASNISAYCVSLA